MKLLIILTLIQIITATNLKSQAILRKSYLIRLNSTFTKNSFNSSIKNESILRKQHILILNLRK
tara:strand:+ start:236 stop:427 length:192 start_codon:yes stop_codon:yes gene_type:complete